MHPSTIAACVRLLGRLFGKLADSVPPSTKEELRQAKEREKRWNKRLLKWFSPLYALIAASLIFSFWQDRHKSNDSVVKANAAALAGAAQDLAEPKTMLGPISDEDATHVEEGCSATRKPRAIAMEWEDGQEGQAATVNCSGIIYISLKEQDSKTACLVDVPLSDGKDVELLSFRSRLLILTSNPITFDRTKSYSIEVRRQRGNYVASMPDGATVPINCKTT